MSEIYRRYNTTQQPTPHETPRNHPGPQQPRNGSSASLRQSQNNNQPNSGGAHRQAQQTNRPAPQNTHRQPSPPKAQPTEVHKPQPISPQPKPKPAKETGILQNILPPSLYNPETKKILGFLSAEDLLLVALIFLFMEDSEEDNPLLALALIYVLLSDFIDLGDLGF